MAPSCYMYISRIIRMIERATSTGGMPGLTCAKDSLIEGVLHDLDIRVLPGREYQLRLILAHRPAVDIGALDSTEVLFTDKEGRGAIQVPSPGPLLDRVYTAMEMNNYNIDISFLYKTRHNIGRISKKYSTSILVAMQILISRMATRSRYDRVIDSSEYSDLCRRIDRTLGSRLLIILATDALVHGAQGREVEKRKAELFALAAIEVAETSETPNFTEWPIVDDKE